MHQHKFFKRLKGTFGFYDLSLKHIVLIQDLWLTLFLQLIYYRQRICIFREQKLQNIPSILARWSVDCSWLSLLPNRRLYFHSIWLSSLTLLTLYLLYLKQSIVAVQSLSCVQLFATPWTAAHQDSLSITNSRSLLKLMPIESVMPSNHLILCHPLLLLPPIPSSIRVFSNESALRMRWPKYWSFSFNISPSSEYPGLISFRMDWLDLLAVQGTLKSLLQHHSSKASVLWHSAFFTIKLSHLYVTAGKTIALTRQTFVSKVMPLLY